MKIPRLLFLATVTLMALPDLCAQHRAYRRVPDALPHRFERVEAAASSENKKAGTAKFQPIPVVFHVMYSGVDEKQVLSQLDALNRDFSAPPTEARHPADTLEGFLGLAADPGLSFALSDAGIRFRAEAGKGPWKDPMEPKDPEKGGIAPLCPETHLNIWVCELASGSGHAQGPGGELSTDGIVIDHRYFGTTGTATRPYDEGKTLTHLLGNYLGLMNIWGTGYCDDDLVDDTPVHNGPNHGCPLYKQASTCDGRPAEMTMNFMDNTDDACMYMFTKGQVDRMRSVLVPGGLREGIVSGDRGCGTAITSPVPGISTGKGTNGLSVYPNPTSGTVTVSAANGNLLTVSAVNSLGQSVHAKSIGTEGGIELTLDCSSWPPGIYSIRATTTEGDFTVPFTINR